MLTEFKDDHYYSTLVGVMCMYLYLQSFAIPGTVFVNLRE